jgi:hypothetical protein
MKIKKKQRNISKMLKNMQALPSKFQIKEKKNQQNAQKHARLTYESSKKIKRIKGK